MKTRVLISAGLALWLLLPRAGRAAELPAQDTLRVVFSPDKFSSVNRNDALASFKAWIETVGRRRGISLQVQAYTYDSVAELRQILRGRTADLLIVRGAQFLELGAERVLMDPLFMPARGEVAQQRYLLLTRRDRHLSLPGLRGKQVIFLNSMDASLARAWVEELLRKAGLGALDSFCPGAQDVGKASAAILPVYFGKADACVVDATSFKVMQELNPQIGQALEACLTSPAYLETVIGIRHDYSQHRADLIDGLARLHDEVAGRQILMVFKVDRLVPFEERELDTVRRLSTSLGRIPGVAAR